MPSTLHTPATLRWSGGESIAEPVRFSHLPAMLAWVGGSSVAGPNLTSNLSVSRVRLDRMLRSVQYHTATGPTMQMQQLWDNNCTATEESLRSLQGQIDTVTVILQQVQAAQEAAAQANQGVAALDSSIALASSRTEPIDGLLTASSSGVVTIAAHSRVYTFSDGTTQTVAVDAGSVSGFASGDFVRVIYADAARAGGAVDYQGTTAEVTQTGTTHVVGGVTIPADGSPPASGTGTTPPGYVREGRQVVEN